MSGYHCTLDGIKAQPLLHVFCTLWKSLGELQKVQGCCRHKVPLPEERPEIYMCILFAMFLNVRS